MSSQVAPREVERRGRNVFRFEIAADDAGKVYFSDSNNNRVRVLIPSGGSGGVSPCSLVALTPLAVR